MVHKCRNLNIHVGFERVLNFDTQIIILATRNYEAIGALFAARHTHTRILISVKLHLRDGRTDRRRK